MASDRTRDYAKSFVGAKDRLTAAGLPDGLRKTFISTLTVKIEQLSAAVVAGDPSISVGELLLLRSALEELEPSTPMTVQVKLVNPSDGAPRMERCRRCGWHYDDYWDSTTDKWVPTSKVPLNPEHDAPSGKSSSTIVPGDKRAIPR